MNWKKWRAEPKEQFGRGFLPVDWEDMVMMIAIFGLPLLMFFLLSL